MMDETHQPSLESARSVMVEVAVARYVYVSVWPSSRSLTNGRSRSAKAPPSRLIEIMPFVSAFGDTELSHVCVVSAGGGGGEGGGGGGEGDGGGGGGGGEGGQLTVNVWLTSPM